MGLAYRADIDGLRAIAVLEVVAFHAFPGAVPGGFVGVDVFFVISGYLITSIVLESLARDRFTFLEFYVRRATRLFPALVLVLAACLLFGRFALFSDELAELGKHVAAGAAFVSNLVLLGEAGYFDRAAALKPLLHLWSLGIEEQFYLVWPFLLTKVWRRPAVFVGLLVLAFALSFGQNVLLIREAPAIPFFFPTSRLWELVLGAGLTGVPADTRSGREDGMRSVASGIGLALVVAATFAFDERQPFPGHRALLPTAGAALLLGAGPGGVVNRRILALRPLVAIGLISYPLYLWHWPLLSFLQIVGATSPRLRLSAVAASFVLATLTWRFVERPVRTGRGPRAALALYGLLAMLGGVGFFAYARLSKSIDVRKQSLSLTLFDRVSPVIQRGCRLDPSVERYAEWCHADRREPPRYVVLGDSHAAALFPGLVAASTPGHRWELIAEPSCEWLSDGVRKTSRDANRDANRDRICAAVTVSGIAAIASDPKVEGVLLALAYRDFDSGSYERTAPSDAAAPAVSRGDLLLDGLGATLQTLRRAGKRVATVIDNPAITEQPALCVVARPLAFRAYAPKCSISRADHERAIAASRALFRTLAARTELAVVDPTASVYCDQIQCNVAVDGQSLYSYSDHLSDVANERVARLLLAELNFR